MRLIDANELIEHMYLGTEYDKTVDDNMEKTEAINKAFKCGWNDALASVMDYAPTVDAVEVVRCKDCKWYEESKNPEIYPMRFCYRLRNDKGVRVGYNCDGNDFCSYGERRDERTATYYGDNKLFETVVIDD